QYLIFDYNVLEPIYIVRRLDDDNLIAWLFHLNDHVLSFPIEALQPLDHITIGENRPFDLSLNSKIDTLASITHPSTHPEAFFNARYQCIACKNESDIYIERSFSLFNIYDVDQPCSVCKREDKDICSGD